MPSKPAEFYGLNQDFLKVVADAVFDNEALKITI
jgi:hypothetical protein